MPVRLGMGRRYAASGQVVDISIDANHVAAHVQGARAEPYRVDVSFSVPSPSAKKKIVAAFAANPVLAARLFAGEMPLEAEEIFRHFKCRLLPGGKIAEGRYDVTFSCSCPDWCNPCKHVVAVLLLLGEEIAERPMRLLELRGLTEEEVSR